MYKLGARLRHLHARFSGLTTIQKLKAAYFLLGAALLVVIVLFSLNLNTIHTQQGEIKEQAKTLHTLVVNNQATLKSQGETALKSAETRVITVSQRCELTGLILTVLVKDDRRRAPAFEKSYKGCEKQLVEVKSIAAQAKDKHTTDGP